jgi:phage recombination protein Bet
MSNEVAERATPRVSLVAKMAGRFNVEPTKLMATLKATAFKSDKAISDEQMMALLVVADQYDLNPFTKEIFAFPDSKGGGIVPVVSVDGWTRIINEHTQFDGVTFETTIGDDGAECTCTIFRKDRAHPTVITEYFAECKRGTAPWSSHPRRMLRHKALIQCARVAFGFAGVFDEDEAQRIVKNMGEAEEVVTADGEIITPAVKPSAAEAVAARRAARQKAAAQQAEVKPADRKPASAFIEAVNAAPDAEAAAIVLDEARSTLTEEEQQQVSQAYSARWQP